MRPQTQALISKLRRISTLSEPGTAEEVIFDIAWRELYSKKQEVRLANVAVRLAHLWISLRGNEDIHGTPVPEMPETPQLNIDLDKPSLKREINLTIANHIVAGRNGYMLHCLCGKEFAAEEEWGNHVRARIWRELKNTFLPIGETDGVNS